MATAHSRSHSDLVVTGWGMVSSLAPDVVTSCAAARAGVRRARLLEDLTFSSAVDGNPVSPIGHAADLLTRGFEGTGRELRVLHAGLADLGQQTWSPSGAPPAGAAFYLSVPDVRRIYTRTNMIPSEARRKEIQGAASEDDRPASADRANGLLERTIGLLGWPSRPPVAFVTEAGRTGVTQALAAAARDLASGKLQGPAIVGGYDCLLDPPTMAWLNELRQLKHADNPVGLEPAEAAAFLVLELADSASQSGRKPRARLLTAHLEKATVGEKSGEALTRAVVAAQAAIDEGPPRWLLSDHDGTAERAADLGQTLTRLSFRWPGSSPKVDYPARSFGDVGAATGAVASCLAVAAWDRGWARAPIALVSSADDAAAVRAVHALETTATG